jgi:hypothetical protein
MMIMMKPSLSRAKGKVGRDRAPLQQQFLDCLHSFLAGHELLPVRELRGAGAGAQEQQEGAMKPGQQGGGERIGVWGDMEQQPGKTSNGQHTTARQGSDWGVQGSGSGQLHLAGFSGRMAAAGLSHSLLLQQKGEANLANEVIHAVLLPPPVSQAELERGEASGSSCSNWGGAGAACSSDGGDLQGNTVNRRIESAGGVSKKREGGNPRFGIQCAHDLEVQCASIAGAMSQGVPCLSWELGNGQHQSRDSIR